MGCVDTNRTKSRRFRGSRLGRASLYARSVNRVRPAPVLPGLDAVLPGGEGLSALAVRTGDNQWLLGLGETTRELSAWPDRWPSGGDPWSRGPVVTDPGIVAATGGGQDAGFLARIELDACGAWVTMACTAELRPLVVRRAGWVDERGDAVSKRHRPWPEDRVGLGPGDAVAVVHRPSPTSPEAAHEVDPVAECLLDHLDSGAQALIEAVRNGPALVAVVAVPVAVAGTGRGWVAEATGVPEGELVLPGYPLGDSEPERWRQPPSAPRRATFRLHRDLTRLRDLRGVLGRLVSSWRLHDRVDSETLTLLTSELATNALIHTDTPATATITYLGPLVRVEVHDGSLELPERREAGDFDVGGRGIALIEELAADWGSTVTSTGKRTWFDFPVDVAGGSA